MSSMLIANRGEGKVNPVPGLCECGCGEATAIANQTVRARGYVKGQPRKFKKGHSMRLLITGNHYPVRNAQREHRNVAERALGKPLPDGAEIHHVDGNKRNNSPGNLVICQSSAYHRWLHKRQRALDATGHANWRKCTVCGEWGSPGEVALYAGRINIHRRCSREYQRAHRQRVPVTLDGLTILAIACKRISVGYERAREAILRGHVRGERVGFRLRVDEESLQSWKANQDAAMRQGEMDGLLPLSVASSMTGVGYHTIRRLLVEGHVMGHRDPYRLRVSVESLLKWAAQKAARKAARLERFRASEQKVDALLQSKEW